MDYQFPIAFADTDAGGVVYHSRYLEIAERARSHWLQQKGYGNQDLLKQGIVFAVHKLDITYHRPFQLDDTVTVKTAIVQQKAATLHLLQEFKLGNSAIYTIINVTLACLKDNKPTRIPANLSL